MRSLSNTIARLSRLRALAPQTAPTNSRLRPLEDFGSNPGQLNAYIHVPADAAPGAPLVVVLHGCTQNAAGYDESSGWSRLADQHGFVLVYPEQQRLNNPNLCFNWFSPDDAARGKGEAMSIRQIVDLVQALHDTDPKRVFVTGLSAGGAMAAAMLATYPETFAGGAVIAGLPFGVARTVPEAFDRMRGHDLPDLQALAGRVRNASTYAGEWPTLSVWHGSADQTVDPSNATALVEQWRSLHQAPETPSTTELVRGNPHRIWSDSSGRQVIEEYSIINLGHGTPLDPLGSDNEEHAAPFMLAAGISSTRLIARFWGIVPESIYTVVPVADVPAEARQTSVKAAQAPASQSIGDTIENALRTAGLMK